MRPRWFFAGSLALALGAALAAAQQPDYLTPEEVELVRETQEPNKRIELFLKFAGERLLSFEKALTPAPGAELAHPDDLRELMNNFIRAVDDAAEALERPLERGGVDLGKSRVLVAKRGDEFLKRLEHIQQSSEVSRGDLRYDLEDAVEATQDLLQLAKKIPAEMVPPKVPPQEADTAPAEQELPPGRPTLKRKRDEKPK